MRGTREVARLTLLLLLSISIVNMSRAEAAETPIQTAQEVRDCDPLPPVLGDPLGSSPSAAGGSPGPMALPGPGSVLPSTPEPIDPPVPSVALRVRVPAMSPPGQPLQYRYIVENTTRAKAHHVVVRNPLPSNVEFVRATPEPDEKAPNLRWDFGTLEPLARREIVLVVKPTAAGEVRCCARVQFDHGQCVTTQIGDTPKSAPPPNPKQVQRGPEGGPAELRLRMTGPPQPLVPVGPPLDYHLEVENVGGFVARGVVLTATFPKDLPYSTSEPAGRGDNPHSWELGDLGPGQRKYVKCSVLPLAEGTFSSKAEVRDATGRRWETSSTIVVGEAKLKVVTTGPASRMVNRPASYWITVSNPGTMPASKVIVTAEVTEGMLLVDAPGGKLGDTMKRRDDNLNREVSYREVRWEIHTLLPKSSRSLQVILQTPNTGTLEQTARAEAAGGLRAISPAVRTQFEKTTGLTVEIDESTDPVEVGGEVQYTIRVINQGDVPAGKVAVIVTIPEQMELLEKRPGNTTGPITGDTLARQEGRRVIFSERTVPLGARSKAEYSIRLKAIKPGDARLSVEVTSEALPNGRLLAQESTTIYADK